jgi:glycosyltransferase involved in cell wall biosynthesis
VTTTATSGGRPIRVDQVIPSIVERDAVSHHTLEAQQVLRSMGFVSEIFARDVGPGLAGRVRPLAELPSEGGGRQWICYQLSIGSPAAEPVLRHPGPKIVNYHNITPSDLVDRWMPFLGEEVRLGREQMSQLAPVTELGIGVSRFNADELAKAGYRRTVVAPLMVDVANFTEPPDPEAARRLAAAKEGGGADWLFVGQMLPHKSHQDVVKAFACYREAFDPDARLHLVGRPSCAAYAEAVRRFVGRLGLDRAVDVAGSITSGELSAYYQAADVLVCCSEHEGFCAPLLEAMRHGVPIVAYSAAAVPETVRTAGVLLDSKEPALMAAAVNRVLSDRRLREQLVDRGSGRAAQFTLDAARRSFADAVESALSGGGERAR